MAKTETKNEPKSLIEAVLEEVAKLAEEVARDDSKLEEISDQAKRELRRSREREDNSRRNLEAWVPKTELGLQVKTGKIKDLDIVLKDHKRILEPEIVETLIHIQTDLLAVGQSKGKFGGGKRRTWRQTQRKTMEGNVVTFSCMAVAGDKNGHVGVGIGKAKETLPAREKATRQSKLNVIKVTRGFESPELEKDLSDPHTVPYKVKGKCGSIRITLLPAPRGTGLVIGDECKKILRLAGIKDVFSITKGQTRTTINVARACIDALSKTNLIMIK